MEEKYLKNKRVLFIGYEYYDYNLHICDAIRKAGAILDYCPIMNKRIGYLISRQFGYKCFQAYKDRHAINTLNILGNKRYDFVFVLLGFQLPNWFYTRLRGINSDAIFINYTWDSVRETEHRNTILDILPFFDNAYSFDRNDCEKYGIQRYLPLFYIDEYAELAQTNNRRDIDLLFIGSLCTDARYKAIQEIDRLCSRKNLKFCYYLRVSYRYFLSRLLKGRFISKTHFTSITHEDIIKYYSSSKAIIDLTGQQQSGLNIRIFEVLGAGKKLITTNGSIINESFYDPQNICIIDIENPRINVDFINNKVDKNIEMSNYSIHSWVKTIFSL